MRSTTVHSEQLPLALQQKIDACCDQFELALQNGNAPDVSTYLENLPAEAQLPLRRELAAIELAYQRTQPHRDSQGLHLRCPHCQNQVELLPEAKLEDITCNSCGDTFSLIEEDNPDGGTHGTQRVGHFELITRLGTGGFGSVWEARDTELDRLVALKLPRKSQLSAREAEQFFREARTAAQLKHPHIVPVHEVGKEGATIFIVTDLIRGTTLSDRLKQQRLSATETAQLCATLAEALAYAHGQGVIHRDLKPSNVMLDEDQQPHIMDFGLAKRELGEITMTVDGTVLGTPAYMSPEQAQGQMHWVDRRTDVYSLGVMLFQMLTGELPYRGTAQQQIQQRIVDDAPDPRKLNAHVPTDLATICLRCVERDVSRRFNNAAEVAAELRRYLVGEPIRSRPISSINRALRWAKREPWIAAAGVLTTVLAIAGPIAAWTIQQDKLEIEKRLVERDGVIRRETGINKELSNQLKTVEQDLDGIRKAHPGIDELSDWHKRLIADFIESNQTSRAELLNQPATADSSAMEVQARSHLGWAYLLNSADQQNEAARHALAARELLESLNQSDPSSTTLRVLLAECLTALSHAQQALDQSDQAAVSISEALAIRTSIAESMPDVLKYQFDQFQSAGAQLSINQSVAEDGTKTAAAIHWAKLRRALEESLEASTKDFYAAACYLTQHEPHLSSDLAPVATGHVLEQDEVD